MTAPGGIVLESVVKRLGERTVLGGVNLTVPPGRMGLIAGHNGSGKTTIVRILSTVIRADAGTVSVAGHPLPRRAAAVRRAIGVAFVNDRSLYWRLDGRANLRLFGQLAGMPKTAVANRTEATLEALGLAALAGERTGRLSTGQRQRLMLARAMLSEPDVLLLDEPLRGLDEEGLGWVRQALVAECKRGAAVLVVAPIVDELRDLANETLVLSDGQLR